MSTNTGALAPDTIVTAVQLTAAFPALCSEIALSAATAERTRILGIEANAMPGHEKLVTAMKTDPTVTPDQAAGRIIAADKALRAGELRAIEDVETVTGGVKPAAVSGGHQPAPETANTVEGWKAEWSKSADLKAEFETAEQYAVFKEAETNGRVKILRRG